MGQKCCNRGKCACGDCDCGQVFKGKELLDAQNFKSGAAKYSPGTSTSVGTCTSSRSLRPISLINWPQGVLLATLRA